MPSQAWRLAFLALVGRQAQAYGYGRIPAGIIVAQAALETGNFTSAIFRDNNNAFGLKEPRVRPTMATGTNRNHATFSTVADSVTDYFLRQRYFHIPNDANYMAATAASGYATASYYIPAWIAAVESRSGMPSPVASVAAIGIPLAYGMYRAISR